MNIELIQILVLVGQFVLGGVLVYLSSKRAPSEKNNLDAGGAKAWTEAAAIKAAENLKLEREIQEIKAELETTKNKKYRVIVEFTIGDPPEPGRVTIEPIYDITIEASKLRRKGEKSTV